MKKKQESGLKRTGKEGEESWRLKSKKKGKR